MSTTAYCSDWYAPKPAARTSDWLIATDSALSVASTGSIYGRVAATAGPAAGRDGLAIRVEGQIGRYAYTAGGGTPVDGQQTGGSLLAGYQWAISNVAVAAYLGVTARNNTVSVPDPTNRTIGSALALKTALELYAEPTTRTMVAAHASYSTGTNAYFASLRAGADAGGRVFVGPEISALGDDFYKQWRVGLYASGMKVGPFALGLSAGVLKDQRNGFGGYSTVDARTSF